MKNSPYEDIRKSIISEKPVSPAEILAVYDVTSISKALEKILDDDRKSLLKEKAYYRNYFSLLSFLIESAHQKFYSKEYIKKVISFGNEVRDADTEGL